MNSSYCDFYNKKNFCERFTKCLIYERNIVFNKQMRIEAVR